MNTKDLENLEAEVLMRLVRKLIWRARRTHVPRPGVMEAANFTKCRPLQPARDTTARILARLGVAPGGLVAAVEEEVLTPNQYEQK